MISATTCGTITAPVSPWTSRNTTSTPAEGATPHASEASANVTTPIRNSRL